MIVPEPDPLTERPPADRYCDLVMTGGVASGVVYPWAILELARHYHFRSLGGTSAGALASALAAASEYGRRHNIPGAFEVLRQLPRRISEEKDGRTKMLRLFQPAPGGGRLFQLALVLLARFSSPDGGPRNWTEVAVGLLKAYGGAFWLALLAALFLPAVGLLGWACAHALAPTVPAWLAALLGLFGGVLAGLGLLLGGLLLLLWLLKLAISSDLRRYLLGNDYGLCRGRSLPERAGDEPHEQALIDWLHEGIQRGAGFSDKYDAPLTFRQLKGAPRVGLDDGRASIDLQIMSTLLSQARPLRLPLQEDEPPLWFDPIEWARFFPEPVMKHLDSVCARATAAELQDILPAVQRRKDFELWRIPGDDLPVLVAARMSMSFPVLLSMLPVWARDEGQPLIKGATPLRKAYLTDGGVCANFPIHLFDAAHPGHPTFALWLDQRRRDAEENEQAVWLPASHLDGRRANWLQDVPGASEGADQMGLKQIVRIFGSFIETLMSWNDRATFRLPNNRGRVVRLALRDHEGSLNLQMKGETIQRMAREYGLLAAQQLVKNFTPTATDPVKPAWREHLYVRYRSLVAALQELTRELDKRYDSANGHSESLEDTLWVAEQGGVLRGDDHRLDGAQRQALLDLSHSLRQLARELIALPLEGKGDYRPLRRPQLRLRDPS